MMMRPRWLGTTLAVLTLLTGLLALPADIGSAAEQPAAGTCPDPSGTVKLGASYFGSVQQNAAEIGAGEDPAAAGDQAIVQGYQDGAAAINATGGIAGCDVEIVPFNFSARAADFNQVSQQECAAFTQDDQVFAAFGNAYESKVTVDCMAKAKTPFVTAGGVYPPTCADYKRYAGYVYSTASIATCRFGSFIKLWDKAGLFPEDAKVGIIALDDISKQGRTLAEGIWTPALKKMGIPAQTFSYTGAINAATFADVGAALSNAVLQFKAAGVNVVLFTPAGAQALASFLPAARAQDYFPNYGMDTADALTIVGTGLGEGAVKTGIAISWSINDLPLTDQQALPSNPTIEACAPWSPSTSSATLTGSSPYCDYLHFLQAAMKGATKLDAASLKKGVEALGTTFVSSLTYDGATKFGKGKYDGATKAMVLEYDVATKTFQPMSDQLVTIP
jgi:ABC-type branched-subunit amino acid transport system substrate-binding protein